MKRKPTANPGDDEVNRRTTKKPSKYTFNVGKEDEENTASAGQDDSK